MELANYYKTISEMGRLEIARRRANGETIGQAPFGFRKVQVNGKSTIAPDIQTFPLLMLGCQMRQDRTTLREICSYLAKRGLRSKRGNLLKPNTMDKVLKRFNSTLTSLKCA
jgi:hypothetical protein